MRIWNNLSGGVVSTAQALIFPKVPNVMVNTGGNKKHAWRTVQQLRGLRKGITIIVLSSAVGGHATYFEYLMDGGLMPFYCSCCDKGKEEHLDRFHNTHLPVTVNVGYCKGEEKRAARLEKKNTKGRKFSFPMLEYSREECEKILRFNKIEASSTYCWFCPKGKNPPPWTKDKMLARAVAARYREVTERRIGVDE